MFVCLLLLIVLAGYFNLGFRISRSMSAAIISSSLIFFASVILIINSPLCGALIIASVCGILLSKIKADQGCERIKLSYPGHTLATLIGLFSLLLVLALTTVINTEPANIDDLLYHYPKLFQHLLYGPFATSGLELVDSYPENGELMGVFLSQLFNADYLVDGFQLLALPLLLASTYHLARGQGLSQGAASLVTLVPCFMPALWSLAITFHVDLFAAALVVASLALFFSKDAFEKQLLLVLNGVALGVLLGTKYVAFPWVAILTVSFCFLSANKPRAIIEYLFFTLPIALLGLPIYLLNWFRFSNPLYPYSIKILGFELVGKHYALNTLWEEQMTAQYSRIEKIWQSWFSLGAISQSNHEHWFGGFGAIWPVLFITTIIAFVMALRSRDRLFIYLVLIAVTLFLITPANHTTRFVLFLPFIAAIGFGKIFDLVSQRQSSMYADALRIVVVIIAIHCVRQNISLLVQEHNGHRAETLLGSCQNSSRPDDLTAMAQNAEQLFAGQKLLVVLHGDSPDDRLLSYGCFWKFAPNIHVTFFDKNQRDQAIQVATENNGSLIVSAVNPSLREDQIQGFRTVFSGKQLSLYQP